MKNRYGLKDRVREINDRLRAIFGLPGYPLHAYRYINENKPRASYMIKIDLMDARSQEPEARSYAGAEPGFIEDMENIDDFEDI